MLVGMKQKYYNYLVIKELCKSAIAAALVASECVALPMEVRDELLVSGFGLQKDPTESQFLDLFDHPAVFVVCHHPGEASSCEALRHGPELPHDGDWEPCSEFP